MTREDLVTSAARLTTPTPASATEFSKKREEMVARVNRTMNTRPDLENLVGSDGRRLSEDNNRNF